MGLLARLLGHVDPYQRHHKRPAADPAVRALIERINATAKPDPGDDREVR
ncbi:MAG: hypothetical protein AB7W59_03285 [Acidimicrobiia bacterium]